MTFGLGDHTRRRRRRVWARVGRTLAYLALAAVFGVSIYRLGLERSNSVVAALEQRINHLTQINARLEGQQRDVAEKLKTMETRVVKLQARYEREVPSGPVKELAALVDKKLGTGVAAQRLAFVIGATRNRRTCGDTALTKRFVVRTALYQGPNSAVSFANNSITITGEGVSARDAENNPEAWFDAAKPVIMHFRTIGGEAFDISGKLPLHHSIVVGDAEHRFSFLEGARGFINVAGNSCPYP